MFDWTLAGGALIVLLAMATLTWMVSLAKQDVGIVDSLWSLFFLASALLYASHGNAGGTRSGLLLALVGAWAARLCVYLTWRNWGAEEDRRYRAIRERNQPHFEWKSLAIVFWLQALLAWVIGWPLLPALRSDAGWSVIDGIGVFVLLAGLAIETLADLQLARFKTNPANRGRVLDTGLWRYSRHPNYFGEFVVWWGVYLIALGAGAPLWTLISPLLLSILLLKVSGVPLLEQDIAERRPDYHDYTARTPAFFPKPPSRAERKTP